MSNRYLTFVSFKFDGGSTWKNFKGSFDNYEIAKAHVIEIKTESMIGEVVDLEIERVVFKIESTVYETETIENLGGLDHYE